MTQLNQILFTFLLALLPSLVSIFLFSKYKRPSPNHSPKALWLPLHLSSALIPVTHFANVWHFSTLPLSSCLSFLLSPTRLLVSLPSLSRST